MIRTKYLIVAIGVCVGIIFSTGFTSIFRTEPIQPVSIEEIHFAVPNDVYTISEFSSEDVSGAREKFILKIRNEVIADVSNNTDESEVKEIVPTGIIETTTATSEALDVSPE